MNAFGQSLEETTKTLAMNEPPQIYRVERLRSKLPVCCDLRFAVVSRDASNKRGERPLGGGRFGSALGPFIFARSRCHVPV